MALVSLRVLASAPICRLVGMVVLSVALHGRAAAEAPPAARHAAVPDAELINQDGEKVKLYSDLVKGRVVALSFIFTSCTTVCSTVGVNMGQLRKELGASPERRSPSSRSASIPPPIRRPGSRRGEMASVRGRAGRCSPGRRIR